MDAVRKYQFNYMNETDWTCRYCNKTVKYSNRANHALYDKIEYWNDALISLGIIMYWNNG